MILIGDIGNTDTKICLINSNYKILKKIILPTKNINKHMLNKKFIFINKKKIYIKKSLFSSVVPKKFLMVKTFIQKKFKIRCIELKNLNLNKIMKIKVNRKQIGSDRLANSIAVTSKSKNFIILDFGTATTFDVVIGNEYNGGVIAPGINISLDTLSKRATLIPPVNLIKIQKVIGKNTISAVRSGFFWGYIGLINNIIELIKKETKKSFKIIITGGFSSLFVNSLRFKVIIDKDITLKGLIKSAKLFNL
jgi:type III pantothenate kinase